MTSLILRNVPEHLHARLKQRAECNNRSLSKEAMALIEQALAAARLPVDLAPPVRLKDAPLSIADVEEATAEGRH